ncbi:MAG: thiamine phosphate synthase [Gemmatimonadales bacterium]
MRPLPRLHAVTDAAVLALEDFPVRAAAIAAAGPAVALHARDRRATGAELTAVTARLQALARPPGAAVFVNARADLALALDTQGLQLGSDDLTPADVRRACGARWNGWIGASVHSVVEALAAMEADFLLVGNIYETASHPGRPGCGLGLLREIVALGRPVIGIGGVTADRAGEVCDAGAWGVATISATWHAADPYRAALALLQPWTEAA